MKLWLVVFATALLYGQTQASVGNYLADQAIGQLSTWVKAEGLAWLTLPGLFKKGDITDDNDEAGFTLAFAGPTLKTIGLLSRSGEAGLDGEDDGQKLSFTVIVDQTELVYKQVAYSDDRVGFYNLSASAISDGFSAQVVLDVKGDGDSCYGFTNKITVTFNDALDVSVTGTQSDLSAVNAAIIEHFKDSMTQGAEVLFSSALFVSLQGYDICSGDYFSLPTADEMTNRILDAILIGINTNIEQWALLPSFENDTTVDGVERKITVDNGVFNKVGTIVKNGDAKYTQLSGWSLFFLDFQFEIDNLQASFENIHYSNGDVEYDLSEIATTDKIQVSFTVTFATKTDIAQCTSVWVDTKKIDGTVTIENQTPDIPSSIVDEINDALLYEMVNFQLIGAADDLFNNAALYAMSETCTQPTLNVAKHLFGKALKGAHDSENQNLRVNKNDSTTTL